MSAFLFLAVIILAGIVWDLRNRVKLLEATSDMHRQELNRLRADVVRDWNENLDYQSRVRKLEGKPV